MNETEPIEEIQFQSTSDNLHEPNVFEKQRSFSPKHPSGFFFSSSLNSLPNSPPQPSPLRHPNFRGLVDNLPIS
jgi:hypothetical protein